MALQWTCTLFEVAIIVFSKKSSYTIHNYILQHNSLLENPVKKAMMPLQKECHPSVYYYRAIAVEQSRYV